MNSSLLQDLLNGQPPFEKLADSTRRKLSSYDGDLHAFLVQNSGHMPQNIPANRIAKICALYQTEHTKRAVSNTLTSQGLAQKTADIITDAAGPQGAAWAEDNPFIAAEYLGWADVCALRQTLNLPKDESRFLSAAVGTVLRDIEEEGDGSTLHSQDKLIELLSSMLGTPELAQRALECAWDAQRLSWHDAKGGGFQSISSAVMEQTIAEWVQKRIPPSENLSAKTGMTQEDAVRLTLKSSLSLIYGSAGTGKTTLLGKIVTSARFQHRRVHLLALAAKAARRIEEETGAEAMTIERFLLLVPKLKLKSNDIIVVDEASMLCLADLYRLVRAAGHCSFALIGDPIQLPPIQTGRPFIDLLKLRSLPTAHLTTVFRQTQDNPVLHFALAVREGDSQAAMKLLQSSTKNLVHISPENNDVLSSVQTFHKQHPRQSQILSSVKDGQVGVHNINSTLARDNSIEHLLGYKSYPIGAPVVVTKNIPDLNLDNGTLGVVYDPHSVSFSNGTKIPARDIMDSIMPAYALTIHKAQGSQWEHICLVIGRSRLLDRSLLYTAATRASTTLTIIGKTQDILAAIQTPPRVFGIQTTLFERIGAQT